MKRVSPAFLFLFFCCFFCGAYPIIFAEQFYKLFHRNLYMYPDNTMSNIVWLEYAVKADFCNPLYALAEIETKEEWEHYKKLFKVHINLKLVELYLILGNSYDKQVAYFYNAPWKEENLECLKIAEQVYQLALYYWNQAKEWSKQIWSHQYYLEEIQAWEEENYRIQIGDLDYEVIISKHLMRLQSVRNDFEQMDENTY
jgi:hypothetical protein